MKDGFRSNPINISSQPQDSDKKKQRNKIARDLEKFLAEGGSINEIERGVSSDKNLDKRLGGQIKTREQRNANKQKNN